MGDTVRITLMGSFLIYINETDVENPVSKSRKGSALMEYLVLNQGRPVPNPHLLHRLWPEHNITNPENALKTLVSRMRTLLNRISDGLGECIVSDRGAYHWESRPGMAIDVLELMDLFETVNTERDANGLKQSYRRILELYKGDLYQTGELEGDISFSQQLHAQYLTSVYAYIEMLSGEGDFNEVCTVCRTALEVDSFDDRLHIELMKAMVSMNRASDALAQYKYATNISYNYLGEAPSPEMAAFFQEMNRRRRSLKENLDSIRRDLYNSNSLKHGAFVCSYELFKAIYNIEIRILKRLGTTLFLGIVTIGDPDIDKLDRLEQGRVMNGLIEILRENLTDGDIITHYNVGVVALLLPTVNYRTGGVLLERIRQLFYSRFPNYNVPFGYRLCLLGGKTARDREETEDGD